MATVQTTDLLISALGGALGALILRSTLRLIGTLLSRWKPLAIYDCAVLEPTKVGELRHTWGQQVPDTSSTNGKAWEYSSIRINKDSEQITGEHTIYGPYLNDFGKPGFYRIRFRIRGIDTSKSNDPIIALDVVQAGFGTEQNLHLLGQRIIRASELSNSFHNFDIVCHASGTGVYEYRCSVFSDAIATSGCKIRFDCIKVYSHPLIWDIF